jgi:hypothetical protein
MFETERAETGPKGAVELTEELLDDVAGGRKAGEGQKDFIKVTLKEVFISSVSS